jgi:hypothetical protein
MLDTDYRTLCSGYPSVRCLQKVPTTFVQERVNFVSDPIVGPAGSWA